MRKLLLIVAVLFFAATSCSNESINEDLQLKSNATLEIEESMYEKIPLEICPPGTHAVLSWEFDTFRFKRPKYDCNRGFWFCSDGHWVLSCEPNQYRAAEISNVDIDNGTTTVSIAIYEGENYIDFYFPKELLNVGGNSLSDFTTFNVDDELMLIEGVTLKKGDYSSRIEDDEIIISVDVK